MLRRLVAARRRRRTRLMLLAGMLCTSVPLLASLLWSPPTLLVWNASASAPIGLYRVFPGAPLGRGAMVAAWTPEPVRSLAAARHYLPANVPLIKRVAASAGDRVCAAGESVAIAGRPAVRRLQADPQGRPMPWWTGCRTLAPGEHFLLMDSPLSFDGRYFGPTRERAILGRAEHLWLRWGRGRS